MLRERCNEPILLLSIHLVTGGSFPFTVGRIEHGHQVRPDLCAVDNNISPRKYLGSFYTDSLVHDPIALKLLLDVIGKVSLYSCTLHTMLYTIFMVTESLHIEKLRLLSVLNVRNV